MDVIHSHVLPKKQKGADCTTCRFSKAVQTLSGEKALLCEERMYDPKTLKCYLPKEGGSNENS